FQCCARHCHLPAFPTRRSSDLPGSAAFKLYDTFGLALDEQQEMAREHGFTIDLDGFDTEMDRQRNLARASWKGAEKTQIDPIYKDRKSTRLNSSHLVISYAVFC